jgi:hypothetical protein
MAVIHNTTLTPTKLELLTQWLPAQPWYAGAQRPELVKAGGFRLDDPKGEVGIEFMVVTDGTAVYQVPMTYRGAPRAGGEGLIGTTEHGVLGRRWVYDGLHDPVLVERLVALIQGSAEPQAQSRSDTPDPTVVAHPLTGGQLAVRDFAVSADGTELHVGTAVDGAPRRLAIGVHRTLYAGDAGDPGVSATWRLPGGAQVRGAFATARFAD